MNSTVLAKYAGVLIAVAMCSACGALPLSLSKGQDDMPVAPSGPAIGVPLTVARPNLSGLSQYPTIVPNRMPRSKFYEYVMNNYGSYASIFDYPKSDQEIGMISNVGGQGCTNVLYGYGKKIIWIVAGPNQVSEYAVPKKLLKTLSVAFGLPTSCAMNTNGDLAIGNYDGGQVVVLKNASGSGTTYNTPLDQEFFDGYDNHGNLFADGYTGFRTGFALVELPKGGSTFETVTLPNTVEYPGSVQWDGKYLTVSDQVGSIYRYTIKGTKATLKGTVTLSGILDCAQTWIVTGIVYCGDYSNNDGKVFKYPAGGVAIAVFSGPFDSPLGVVAAEK